MTVYDYSVKTANGQEESLDKYAGQVLLIVNTASKCVFTSQYKGLEKLQEKFGARGFNVLGFPCNQFGNQEPGSNEDIQRFCQMNYHVSFPVFAKIDVNGDGAHPLYRYLATSAPGILSEAIKWNFTKFLVDKRGNVVKRYAPSTPPNAIASDIKKLLNV